VTPDVRPFPFSAFEAFTRAEADGAARLRRIARSQIRIEAVADALSGLVGDPVTILVRRTKRMDPTKSSADSVGVMFAPSGATVSAERVLVELDGALAAAIAARALQQRAPRITEASRATSPALAGAVAAVLSAALRRAHAGTTSRVVSAGPGPALARDLATSEPHATTAWLTVTIGPDAYEARVSVPDHAPAIVPPRLTVDDLLSMGTMPIALPLVAASVLATRAEISGLATGDAFVPAAFPLTAENGALAGPVALVAPASETGIGADLARDGRLVVRGLVEPQPWDVPMTNDTSRTMEALDDAPVVVRVELGVVEMKAQDWAKLEVGDIVSVGRRVGEPTILRVGGVEVARGELVTIDGEIGVRITSRMVSRGGGGE
jgi:flagellar motor switch/type III secretory pathway protein FliN